MKKCVNGEYFEMTAEELEALKLEITPEMRIAELEQNLADTDYHIFKLAEGAITLAEIAEIIEKRKAWRKEINELEAEIEKGEG